MTAKDAEWWRGAALYEIYPRSFQDSDGNGVGDLAGITRRLGYVADLGVDAIWIAPFFLSPMKDFGYDVSDYRAVDPIFGTLADFDALVEEAHRLGLKVLIDQILSHSSDQHPWFRESRLSRANPKADWYVWADPRPDGTPPNNWQGVFGGSGWTWNSQRRQYYFHNFLVEQPDLNLHNREVQDELLAALAFWLDRGVDGFRLDAVNHYFHDPRLRDNPPLTFPKGELPPINPYLMQDHLFDKNQPENLAFLARLRAFADRYDQIALLGEIGDQHRSLELMAAYTGGGDKLSKAYTFDFLGPIFTAPFFRSRIERFESEVEDGWPCWAFSNHDVVRQRTRWDVPGEGDRIARLAAAILVALRGSICLYQGEELGLPEADLLFDEIVDPYGKSFWPEFKGRDGCRTPMPWEADADNAAFSSAKPWLRVPAAHRQLAVDRQIADADSMLHHYRRLLRLRRAEPALRRGSLAFLDAPTDVLAMARMIGDDGVVCLFNLGEQERVFVPPTGLELTALDGAGGDPFMTDAKRGIGLPPRSWHFARSSGKRGFRSRLATAASASVHWRRLGASTSMTAR